MVKNILKTLFVLITIGMWLKVYNNNTDTQSHSEMPNNTFRDTTNPEVAFDWANNRSITRSMADTMALVDKKWMGKTELIQLTKQRRQYLHDNPSWIKPGGRQHGISKKDATYQLWKEQQRMQKEQQDNLTEEDVRQIVQSELDGNH